MSSYLAILHVFIFELFVSAHDHHEEGFDANLASSIGAECTLKCDSTCDSAFYDITNGTCRRNGREGRFFLLGPVYCMWSRNFIHERSSCEEFNRTSRARDNPRFTRYFDPVTFDFDVVWDSSDGCYIQATPPQWLSYRQINARKNVCFHSLRAFPAIVCVLAGLIGGAVFGTMGTKCYRKHVRESFGKHVNGKDDFEVGAKLMATDEVVKGSGTRRLTMLYRLLQILTNIWFPVAIAIIVNPLIVYPLWVLLYALPGYHQAGCEFFNHPFYLVTPPDVSLYGVDKRQPDFAFSYLFSAVRPFLMVFLTYVSIMFIEVFFPWQNEGVWIFNQSDFFRAGMMEGPSPLVLDLITVGAVLGALVHTPMTIWLVWQYWREGVPHPVISLVKNEPLALEATELAENLCEVALEVAAKDSDDFSSDDEKTMQCKYEELGVTPMSRTRLYGALLGALVDYCAYLYKIFVFLRSGRYVLGTFVMIAFAECVFMLLIRGELKRFPVALRTSLRVGLPTRDFLAVVQFKGLFGVLYQMITIYGLPLSGIRTWPGTLLSMLFLCTGTWNMAKFIVEAIDMDTFDIVSGEKELTDMFSYVASSSEHEDECDNSEGDSVEEYEPLSVREPMSARELMITPRIEKRMV